MAQLDVLEGFGRRLVIPRIAVWAIHPFAMMDLRVQG
jgi:hypothetical protein